MPASRRVLAEARAGAARLLVRVGRELRDARVQRALSQATVARAAGISQAQLSLIERGMHSRVGMDTLVGLASALGLDLSLRLFPGGEPIRDAAHARLLARFRLVVGEQWQWAAEVPLPIAGDRRAWDRLLSGAGAGVRIGIEGETKPTDMQELQRRLGLKKRDGGVDQVILVMPDSEWCRRLLRLNDMSSSFPVPGSVALRALRAGRDPGGDSVILVPLPREGAKDAASIRRSRSPPWSEMEVSR